MSKHHESIYEASTCESILTTSDAFFHKTTAAGGRLMAERCARRKTPPPISLAEYARQVISEPVRDGVITYQRHINMEEVQKLLEQAEEAEKAEALKAKPLPPRPSLRDVLKGPQCKPFGTEHHIRRLSIGRERQEERSKWIAKVDGKKDSGETEDNLWKMIAKGRWSELDQMIQK